MTKTNNKDKAREPIMNLYAVQDMKAGRFFPPFLNTNHQTAERAFAGMIKTDDSELAKNPEDYRLFFLGDFDPLDGQIDSLSAPELICDAIKYANLTV